MKLKALGLSQDVSRWFQSYLSDRQQLVDVSGTLSSHANISCGVPQGSILGPLLFLTFVNDMSGAISNKLLLYADDCAILVADKCLYNIETVLQNELEIVSEWLVYNKLSLNLGKTESILFGSRPRLKSQSVLSITCKGTVIEAKNYLSVVLEQCLSGANMATSVIQKVEVFIQKEEIFNLTTKKQLFMMSLIQCHFDYACFFLVSGLI